MYRRHPQDIADFFGCYVAMDKDGEWLFYHDRPELSLEKKMWTDGGVSSRAPNEAFLDVPPDHDWTTLYEPRPLSEKAKPYNDGEDLCKGGLDPINDAPHQSAVHVHQEYVVFRADNILSLEDGVNRLLPEGWSPIGGVAVYHDLFYQAMVRGLP